jgi:hypothetical protein
MHYFWINYVHFLTLFLHKICMVLHYDNINYALCISYCCMSIMFYLHYLCIIIVLNAILPSPNQLENQLE